ncbi:hypothetical protein AB7828_26090 [Tardiphaga sp. 215_C5_N2_1]|jgi:hypothetical protein
MTPQLASILADLDIEVVETRVRREPEQTSATVHTGHTAATG